MTVAHTTIVLYNNGNEVCLSYQVPVASYFNTDSGFGAVVLSYDWDRSITTISHVSKFLMRFCGRKLRAAEIRAQIANGGITVTTREELKGMAC